MKVTVRDLDGDDAGELDLPEVFETTFRPDLVKRAVLAAQANRQQDTGTDEYAGLRTPAESHGSGRGTPPGFEGPRTRPYRRPAFGWPGRRAPRA